MGNLANSLAQLGQYVEAEDLQKDALERSRRVYSLHDLNTPTTAYNLACQYGMQGRTAEGLSYLEQSIQYGLAVHIGLLVAHDEELKFLRCDALFEALANEARTLARQAQKGN